MRYLNRLPLLLALAGSIVSGLLSIIRLRAQKEILVQMALVMVIFYVAGLFLRSTVQSIKSQVDEKKLKQEEENRTKKSREEKENTDEGKTEKSLGGNIDFTVDESDDAFDPLPVSEYIKNELKKS